MPGYRLASGLYLLPTPGGTYYAVSGPEREPARLLLFKLLGLEESPLLNIALLRHWVAARDEQAILELLARIQGLGWIQGESEPRRAPAGPLEAVLPALLANLSSTRKALLADAAGFYVASHGYPHETAEELSALSADLASLYGRHRGLLYHNMGLRSAAWGVVDAAGHSQVGFWPLYIGEERFVMVIAGLPRLNQPAFTELVWALAKRYALDAGPIALDGSPAARGRES